MEQLGCKHVKGILLYGPPGTGKTLMARQIGQMLNSREPKIVNGPQILDKYVGESEANIRRLFEDAEEEERRMGPNSGLHIIIFDEIDAICKARGSQVKWYKKFIPTLVSLRKNLYKVALPATLQTNVIDPSFWAVLLWVLLKKTSLIVGG